jgi:Undecaprenyl-phosphate galactose phosphotransferase WbaP
MAETGATLPRRAASTSDHRGWRKGDAGLVERFRKPIVAAALISGDVVAAIAAIALIREGLAGTELPGARHLSIAFLILMFFSVGLYRGCGPSPYERFRLRMISIMGFVAFDFIIGYPVGEPALLLAAAVCKGLTLLIFGHYGEVAIRTLLIRLDLWGAPTVLVGCDDKSKQLAQFLMLQPALGLTPVGFIATPRDGPVQKTMLPLPLIGATADPGPVRRHVEFAIFNSADELSALISRSQEWMSSCRFMLVDDVHDIQSLWLSTRMLGGAIGIEIRRDLCLRKNQLLKRVIDVLLAIPLGLLALPIIGLLVLAIKLVDPGPAFFVADRVGRNGSKLRMFKLRTMYADAEQRLEEHLSRDPSARAEWERFFKLGRDPRLLPIIGSFMRRASLDELPQLWNVVRGDMSLVGPRPFPAYHMNGFDAGFRATRVSVQPGITGMWQVSSRSDGDLPEQRAQDLFYIKNWSIWLDIYILLQTLPAVLSGKGAR